MDKKVKEIDVNELLKLIRDTMDDLDIENILHFSTSKLDQKFLKFFNVLRRFQNIIKKSNHYDSRLASCKNGSEIQALERSKEFRKIRQDLEDYTEEFAKALILLYNDIHIFYKLTLLKDYRVIAGIIFFRSKMNGVFETNKSFFENTDFKETDSESHIAFIKNIDEKLETLNKLYEEYSSCSVYKLIKFLEVEFPDRNLIWNRKNYIFLTKFRNMVAHEDLGNFLGRFPIEFIPVMEKVFNEIFEDIKNIIPIMDHVFPVEKFFIFNDIQVKGTVRNNYGRLKIIENE